MTETPFLQLVRERRSVRAFDPDRPVPGAVLEHMLETARLAPSSNNTQPWHFVVVRDPEALRKLATAAPAGTSINRWMKTAPAVIVCCGQPNLLAHTAMGQLVDKNWFIMDIAIAVEHMVLAAREQGVGTCWVGWYDEKKVRRIVGAPRTARIAALLPVGYPQAGKWPPAKKRKPMEQIVSWERFGQSQA
jgi:nitroreductase